MVEISFFIYALSNSESNFGRGDCAASERGVAGERKPGTLAIEESGQVKGCVGQQIHTQNNSPKFTVTVMAHFPSRHSSTEDLSAQDENYYSSSFDPGSSFQMNPLSARPPRTPRTSIIASSQVYGTSLYAPQDQVQDDVEESDDGDRLEQAESRVLREEVFREMVLTSNGRDKAFVRRKLHLTLVV